MDTFSRKIKELKKKNEQGKSGREIFLKQINKILGPDTSTLNSYQSLRDTFSFIP